MVARIFGSIRSRNEGEPKMVTRFFAKDTSAAIVKGVNNLLFLIGLSR